jgi:hypothetical protein
LIAAEFVATTNLNSHQAASPAMRHFIIELMQLGLSQPCEERLKIVEIAPLVDRITDATRAEAIY